MSQVGTSLGNNNLSSVSTIQPRTDVESGVAGSRAVKTVQPSVQSSLFQPVAKRSADGAATPVINVEFGVPAGSVAQIKQRLDDQLSAFYRIFYKVEDQQREITNKVSSSLASLIDGVANGDFSAIQFRFASVETQFADGNGKVFGSTRQFALEVSAVSRTENTVSASSVQLFGLSGSRISLGGNEAQTGLVTGLYTRSASLEEQSNPVLARQPSEVDDIINSLRQTQEALLSYRDGDFRALNSLIGSLTGSGSSLTFNV
tara:strand:- start:18050 stop:18829 length:780 start_codon:yes stop_codon:yes gene_type:complete